MRTIESPGVEIKEIDLSFNTQLPYATTVFAVGYASQGPTDETINITSSDELEQVYGLPTNAAERYFYHTCKQVLNANGNLLTTRLPYGSGSGDGFTNKHSALVFPVFPYKTNDITTNALNTIVAAEAVVFETASTTASAYAYPYSRINSDSTSLTNIAVDLYVDGINGVDIDSVTFELSGTLYNLAGVSAVNVTAAAPVTFILDSATNNISSSVSYLSGSYEIDSNESQDLISLSLSSDYFFGTTSTFKNSVKCIASYNTTTGIAASGTSTVLKDADTYYIGQPYHMSLTDEQYLDWEQGGILWKDRVPKDIYDTSIYSTSLSGVGYAGMIFVNTQKSSINDDYSGFYLAIADNSKANKGSNFDSIQTVKTINSTTVGSEWLTLNSNRLDFEMTGSFNSRQGSVSEIVESLPSFDFSVNGVGGYSDCLTVAAFKVRPAIYNTESRLLGNVLSESYVGSLDYSRTIDSPNGGGKTNFSLEKQINENSNYMKLFVNPYIGGSDNGVGSPWFDRDNGAPIKKVRVVASERTNENSSVTTDPAQPNGKALELFNSFNASRYISNSDNLYAMGEFSTCYSRTDKFIGNLPLKLERALRLAENYEQIRIDIVAEGGLGTIWTGTELDLNNWPDGATNRYNYDQTTEIFDDTVKINGILNAHTFDKDSAGLLDQRTGSSSEAQDLWETIFNIFNNFCQFTRKDCLQISDPLRYIFVQGNGEVKVMDDKNKNFSQHIYWPLKNLFGATNTSYACTYGNWLKTNDKASDKMVWIPPSGFLARQMVDTDTNFYPWYAPAGLTRGILRDVLDIAINPTTKQRDLMYKININPIVYWPGDGYIVWGQKTLQAKPSAFDRINVRRMFLYAEKAVLPIARYFVFELNTATTRRRLTDAVTPVFEYIKKNEGLYEYLIVCDDRNNTADVIDRNELVADIYMKPSRISEFVLLNFIATRTGQNFEELV